MPLVESPEYRDVAEDLLETWVNVLSGNKVTVINKSPFDRDKAIRVLALANHVFAVGRISLGLLVERNPVVVAVPTIRTGYECALTAMWIAQSSTDGVQGWLAQSPATRRAIKQTLQEASSPGLRLIATKVVGTEPIGIESNSTLQARTIAEMLNDFEGGADLYAFYRYLCGFTHASPSLTDEYVQLDRSPGSVGYQFSVEPKTDLARSTHVHAVATTMLWALSAVRFIHQDNSAHRVQVRALRSRLQSSAGELGSPVALHLTAEAHARQAGRQWGAAKPVTAKSLRVAAKARGYEFASSPGTGSDNPVSYLWQTGLQGYTPKPFSDIRDAFAYLTSQSDS